jgi:hypothetical protein
MEEKKIKPVTHVLRILIGFAIALVIYLIVKGVG